MKLVPGSRFTPTHLNKQPLRMTSPSSPSPKVKKLDPKQDKKENVETKEEKPEWDDRFIFRKPERKRMSPSTPHPRIQDIGNLNQLRGKNFGEGLNALKKEMELEKNAKLKNVSDGKNAKNVKIGLVKKSFEVTKRDTEKENVELRTCISIFINKSKNKMRLS